MNNLVSAQINYLSRIKMAPSRCYEKKITLTVSHPQVKLGKRLMVFQNVNFFAKMAGLNRTVDVVKWEFSKGAKIGYQNERES